MILQQNHLHSTSSNDAGVSPRQEKMTSETKTEIGIIFGFIAIFLLVITSYGIVWKLWNKKEAEREAARKAGLIERGFGPKGGQHNGEKLTGDAGITAGH